MGRRRQPPKVLSLPDEFALQKNLKRLPTMQRVLLGAHRPSECLSHFGSFKRELPRNAQPIRLQTNFTPEAIGLGAAIWLHPAKACQNRNGVRGPQGCWLRRGGHLNRKGYGGAYSGVLIKTEERRQAPL